MSYQFRFKALLTVLLSTIFCSINAAELNAVQLGELIFMDKNLSEPAGQACASCHDPKHFFIDPDQDTPMSAGVNPDRFGNRNTPTAMYASYTPEFHFDEKEGLFVGGQFLDGREINLQAQAKQPLLNIVEMANPNAASVVKKIAQAAYAAQFKTYYGQNIFNDTEQAFDKVASALAAFENSSRFHPFSSKYDLYLQGKVSLTAQESQGLKLFEAEDKGNCAACHPSQMSADNTLSLFTDYTYDNIGVPKNMQSPFLSQSAEFNPDGKGYIDLGLGGRDLGQHNKQKERGKFRVATLRNIAKTAPYMHNGIFDTLDEVMDFYNTRDIDDKWAAAEVIENVNTEELGDLKLTDAEVDALVAFLKTLTDGYVAAE